MRRAIGLSFTKVVSTFTGSPRHEEMLATLVSALVACMKKVWLQWTGCPSTGVMRTPMLVGTSRAWAKSFFRAMVVRSVRGARRFFVLDAFFIKPFSLNHQVAERLVAPPGATVASHPAARSPDPW